MQLSEVDPLVTNTAQFHSFLLTRGDDDGPAVGFNATLTESDATAAVWWRWVDLAPNETVSLACEVLWSRSSGFSFVMTRFDEGADTVSFDYSMQVYSALKPNPGEQPYGPLSLSKEKVVTGAAAVSAIRTDIEKSGSVLLEEGDIPFAGVLQCRGGLATFTIDAGEVQVLAGNTTTFMVDVRNTTAFTTPCLRDSAMLITATPPCAFSWTSPANDASLHMSTTLLVILITVSIIVMIALAVGTYRVLHRPSSSHEKRRLL